MTTARSWKYVLKNTPEDGETPLMRTPVSLGALLFTLKHHISLHCAIILTDSQPALILTLGTVHKWVLIIWISVWSMFLLRSPPTLRVTHYIWQAFQQKVNVGVQQTVHWSSSPEGSNHSNISENRSCFWKCCVFCNVALFRPSGPPYNEDGSQHTGTCRAARL